MELTDRYEALGIPYPDPQTMCRGECEGTGIVPVQQWEEDTGPEARYYENAWLAAHTSRCTVWGTLRALWKHREWWFWRMTFRDLITTWRLCDGWHFVQCYHCHGTGKQPHEGA